MHGTKGVNVDICEYSSHQQIKTDENIAIANARAADLQT